MASEVVVEAWGHSRRNKKESQVSAAKDLRRRLKLLGRKEAGNIQYTAVAKPDDEHPHRPEWQFKAWVRAV
jgi:quinol monooxygenase YgiN